MEPTDQEDRLSSLEFSIRVLEHVRNSDQRDLTSALHACTSEIAALRNTVLRLEGEIELLRFLLHQVCLRSEDTDVIALAPPVILVDLDSLD